MQPSSYCYCWRSRPLLLTLLQMLTLLPPCLLSPLPAPSACLQAQCACDICQGHMPHDQLMARMARSVFCPILPSNTQSSRRLSEAMLAGEATRAAAACKTSAVCQPLPASGRGCLWLHVSALTVSHS